MAVKLLAKHQIPFHDKYRMEYIADTDADLNNLPACTVTGSTAVSLESGTVKVVNTQGKWVTFGG